MALPEFVLSTLRTTLNANRLGHARSPIPAPANPPGGGAPHFSTLPGQKPSNLP